MRAHQPWLSAVGLILAAAVALRSAPGSMEVMPPSGTGNPASAGAAESELAELTAQEQVALADLFALNRQLEQTRAALAELDEQGALLARDMDAIRQRLQEIRARQDEGQTRLGRRLRWVQVHGSFAFFAVLLGADSLSDFLDRLETVIWLMRRDAALLAELRELKATAAAEEQLLATRQEEWAAVRVAHVERERELVQAIAEKEAILSSLKDRRAVVEAALARIEQDWFTAAMPVLEALGSSLLELDVASLEPDTVQVTLFPPGAVVRISEESLNRLIAAHGELAGMTFRIQAGEVGLEGVYAGVPVRVWGGFALVEANVVQYRPTTMQVRDFVVPQRVAEELLAQGWFDIDLGDLVDPFVIKEVRSQPGVLIFQAGL
ncbi:MAG TPA: hypothetical protein VIL07_09835 [Symbiobacteriaceae bacterium]